MKRLDYNADGEISYDEFYQAMLDIGKFQQPHELTNS